MLAVLISISLASLLEHIGSSDAISTSAEKFTFNKMYYWSKELWDYEDDYSRRILLKDEIFGDECATSIQYESILSENDCTKLLLSHLTMIYEAINSSSKYSDYIIAWPALSIDPGSITIGFDINNTQFVETLNKTLVKLSNSEYSSNLTKYYNISSLTGFNEFDNILYKFKLYSINEYSNYYFSDYSNMNNTKYFQFYFDNWINSFYLYHLLSNLSYINNYFQESLATGYPWYASVDISIGINYYNYSFSWSRYYTDTGIYKEYYLTALVYNDTDTTIVLDSSSMTDDSNSIGLLLIKHKMFFVLFVIYVSIIAVTKSVF